MMGHSSTVVRSSDVNFIGRDSEARGLYIWDTTIDDGEETDDAVYTTSRGHTSS